MPAASELEVSDFIQAYEAARANGGGIDLAQFLPPLDHPGYAEIQRALLARDLAYREGGVLAGEAGLVERTIWNNGRIGTPKSEAFADGQAGGHRDDEVTTARVLIQVQRPEESGLGSKSSPRASSGASSRKPRSNGNTAERLAGAMAGLPAPGDEFLGFRILAELGRGAFGRVYLAQQRDLASRYVALKVSPDILGESQTLAQLQHTNIVPIYSVHRASPYQAVCMPYFGATTLADLLKNWRERESLPESGKELVSTLCGRKSTTRQLQLTNAPQAVAEACTAQPAETAAACSMESLPRLGEPQGTAILEMLQGLSFVDAVLWIASRLADGLAHAHERGILHRDLKPANVLLTDEGQPMLLDFSVAEDTKLRREAVHAAQVGGTLSYMSPEHLEAFQGAARTVDSRSDLYSLGLILFEMLTRHDPFQLPSGSVKEALPRILEDRKGPVPSLRCWNKDVSPAVESIVRHCLQPDPRQRYQSAQELREDLDRHRANLPLKYAPEPSLHERARKWVRRHPRLTSLTSLGILAGLLLGSAVSWSVVHGLRLNQLEAQETLNRFHEDTKTVQFVLNARSSDRDQLDEGIKLGRQALATYRVLDNPGWHQEPAVHHLSAANQTRLRGELEDLLLLLARATLLRAATVHEPAQKQEDLQTALRLNQLAETMTPEAPAGQALLAQRAELAALLGQPEEARHFRQQAEQAPLRSSRDLYLAGTERVAQGRYREALPLLKNAAGQDPQNFWARLVLGICYDGLSQDVEARACYTTSIALWPEFPWTYFNRGLTYLRQNDFAGARQDFDHVVSLRPDYAEAYINRAVALQGLKKYEAAIQDLTQALQLGAPYTRVYFMRARVRQMAGDQAGAQRDFTEGLRQTPTDEKSWIARGFAKLPADLPGALADFEKAAELNPRSLAALQNQAHVLSKLGRNQQALQVLDRVVELYPDYVPARAGRGVLRARLKQRKEALEDADDALARDFGAATQYQVAGIFALTSQQEADDRHEALRYLSSALRRGFGFDLLEGDKELDPIRDRPEFRKLVNAARALQPAAPVRPGESPPR
jgi:serine/threonine protein kinase/tetratricopeptide (TPR) repeat protein